MPPAPSILKTRYGPSQPISPGACGGDRKSYNSFAGSTLTPPVSPVSNSLAVPLSGSTAAGMAVVSSPGAAGDVIPDGRTAAGVLVLIDTVTICPQEHCTFWPV